MRREAVTPRPGWQSKLEQLGFDYHIMDGKAYWTEQACYAFSVGRDRPARSRHRGAARHCLKAVEHVVADKLWERMRIPPAWGDYIERTVGGAPTRRSVGRFDLAYDGKGPPKLLEYNADTPTALYEAAVVQWYWLKDVKPERRPVQLHPREADRGLARRPAPAAARGAGAFRALRGPAGGSRDRRNTCATPPCRRASPASRWPSPQIGWNGKRFTDPDEMPIQVLSKLYPWEWMVREAFGAHVLADTTAFIEPAWKMILSNKMLLPLLWEGFPGHANLLPAFDTEHPDLGGAT